MIVLLLSGVLLVGMVLLAISSTASVVPWLDRMTRENPGVRDRAEWIAPVDVIEAVKGDYLAFYTYAAARLRQGWIAYGRDLENYLADDMLAEQMESIALRLQNDRGRVVDVLRADHDIQVRNFSTDGLRCIVIDHRSDQRLATYDYWNGNRLHTQDMGAGTYVYEMAFDQRADKWKLARFVQCLPPGTRQAGTLVLTLPQTAGRDQ
jgi:hypothetical protein